MTTIQHSPLSPYLEQIMGIFAQVYSDKQLGKEAQTASVEVVSGGCIAQSYLVRSINGQCIFVKLQEQAPKNLFVTEARALSLIDRSCSIRVPGVLGQLYSTQDRSESRVVGLALEVLEFSKPFLNWAESFAHDLAEMHRVTQLNYGFETDNFIGLTPQRNPECEEWVEFFSEYRLRDQFRRAYDNELIPARLRQPFDQLLSRLSELIESKQERPALVHGDLWSGNWDCVDSQQVSIFDPAAYFGCREVDLAMTELFGRLPHRFYEAYNEHFPLEAGYQERREIYNLYHLLNHLNLFGVSYLSGVEKTISRFS